LIATGGQAASRARRLALSSGKASLPPSADRTRSSTAALSANASHAPAAERSPAPLPPSAPAPAVPSAPSIRYDVPVDGSTHAFVRARRAALSRHGRGNQPPAHVAHRERPNVEIDLVSLVGSGQPRVTSGSPSEPRVRVTGEPPAVLSETATAKVGFARTAGGLVVSGTLVRSRIPVTGDEPAGAMVTGKTDQRIDDDLTARSAKSGAGRPARAADPHGATVFGISLGNGRRLARTAAPSLETTVGGHAVTGSAVGPSVRVTGLDSGQCRPVTGDQYVTPETAQSACGGTGGGTAAAAHLGGERRDPVTGAKVVVSQTGAGRRITGFAIDPQSNVTGARRGLDAEVTGSQYQALATPPRPARAPALTGDVPYHDPSVTGTSRGAERSATGTPYFEARGEKTVSETPVADLNGRFSVRSPQREAHLRAAARAGDAAPPEITGAFAAGARGITGNLEFTARPRAVASERPARGAVTGEGSVRGTRITGSAWSDHGRVTGTDGAIAQTRNPSERAGKPHAFASARLFKNGANGERREAAKHLVTGTFGYDSAARVTLSGGAQG
jgi:hypothetical protein